MRPVLATDGGSNRSARGACLGRLSWSRRFAAAWMLYLGGAAGAAAGGLAVVDLTAPGARLAAAVLDELLEAVEVRLDAPADEAQRPADLLLEVLRRELHVQLDLGRTVVHRVEDHGAVVRGAALLHPGEYLVRYLARDARGPVL